MNWTSLIGMKKLRTHEVCRCASPLSPSGGEGQGEGVVPKQIVRVRTDPSDSNPITRTHWQIPARRDQWHPTPSLALPLKGGGEESVPQ